MHYEGQFMSIQRQVICKKPLKTHHAAIKFNAKKAQSPPTNQALAYFRPQQVGLETLC
jgi:hypothetical protein